MQNPIRVFGFGKHQEVVGPNLEFPRVDASLLSLLDLYKGAAKKSMVRGFGKMGVEGDEVLVKMKSLPYPDERRMLSSRLMTVAQVVRQSL